MSASRNSFQPTGLNPGDKLDKFEIIEQVGSGGMSVVWKAYDRLLDRHVAIKQFNSTDGGAFDEDLRERFKQETRLHKTVATRHPHLVHLIDVIDDERGLFMIMEFVDGPSLEQLLVQRKGPLDQRQALGYMAATAVALQAIHEAKVLHRDLKPSNILLPAEGGLKVADFGVAAVMAEQDAMNVGTVRYMAPELFKGETVDGRADIYSLGIVAYEMLVGREAFDDAFKLIVRDQRNQALRWMKWHTNVRVVAPPASELNPNVPEWLSELVARMMDKDRDRRINSAAELVDAIRRQARGGDTSQKELRAAQKQPVGSHADTAPVPKRSKLPLILAANLIILTLAGVGFLLYQQNEQAKVAEAVYEADVRVYNQALTHLRANEYHDAMLLFNQLAQRYPKDANMSSRSLAYATYAAARLEQDARNYVAAMAQFNRADELSMQLRITEDDDVLHRDNLRREHQESDRRMTAEDLLDKIDKLLDGRQIHEAERAIETFAGNARLHTGEYRQAIAMLRDRLAQIRDLQYFLERMAAARAKYEAGDIEGALDIANAIRTDGLSAGEREQLAEFIRRCEFERDRNRVQMLAERAERGEDWITAISEYQKLAEMEPHRREEIEPRLRRFRGIVEFDEGEALLRQNQLNQAVEKFTVAAGYGHDGAQRRLVQLNRDKDRAAKVAAGQAELRRRQWDAAIAHLEEAQQMQRTDDVAQAIRQAQVGKHLTEGLQLSIAQRDEESKEDFLRRLEQARLAFRRVLQLADNHPRAVGGIAAIDSWVEYHKLMDDGRARATEGQFADAIRQFLAAQRQQDTSEVRSLIQETHYASHMRSARQSVQRGEWSAARGYALSAIQHKRTPEAMQIIEQAEAELKKREQRDAA